MSDDYGMGRYEEVYGLLDHERFEPQAYFIDVQCTCPHDPPEHGWAGCEAEGCACNAHWEE